MNLCRERLIRILQEQAAAGSSAGQTADRILAAEGGRYRHLKRGTVYQVRTHAELQAAAPVPEGTTLTIYIGDDGRTWARPKAEFEDGRFEALP
jgi:hypothetical protein